jgi:hypothetical protein
MPREHTPLNEKYTISHPLFQRRGRTKLMIQ